MVDQCGDDCGGPDRQQHGACLEAATGRICCYRDPAPAAGPEFHVAAAKNTTTWVCDNMKTKTLNIILGLCLCYLSVFGQGTLQIDQQSGNVYSSTVALTIQDYQPMGQSFTPSLAAVGFIQLQLYDPGPINTSGATIYLNLRSGSFTGTILSSTTPVFMPPGYGYGSPAPLTTFLFPTAVSVTSGMTYFFDINVEAGSAPWKVGAMERGNTYSGGSDFVNGTANPNGHDLLFTEGVVVPEPSAAWGALLGGGLFLGFHRWQNSPARHENVVNPLV
jgi:hypothetical protein